MYFKIYGTGWSWLPRPTQGASPAASLDGRWPRNVGGEATHKPPLTHLFLHNNNTLQIFKKFLSVKPISFDMRTFHASDCVDAWYKWDEISLPKQYKISTYVSDCKKYEQRVFYKHASICFAKLSLAWIHVIVYYCESQLFWSRRGCIATVAKIVIKLSQACIVVCMYS